MKHSNEAQFLDDAQKKSKFDSLKKKIVEEFGNRMLIFLETMFTISTVLSSGN